MSTWSSSSRRRRSRRRAYAELARSHRQASADRTRGRRAPVRLRPPLRPDRPGARLERRGRAPGRVLRRPPATKRRSTMNTVSPELDRRFRDAAAATGLLDVAYDLVDSPVGPLLVAVSERGLCKISFDPDDRARAARARLRSPRAPHREADRPGAPPAGRVLRGRPPRLRAAARPRRRRVLRAGPRRAGASAVRRDDHLRRARRPDGAPEGRPRDRDGDAPKPGADRAPVPSRDRRERQPHRLRRRAPGEEVPARARAGRDAASRTPRASARPS